MQGSGLEGSMCVRDIGRTMAFAAMAMTAWSGIVYAQSATPNRRFGRDNAIDDRPLPTPEMTADEKNRLAYLARGARDVDELKQVVTKACDIQGWQFSLKEKDLKGVTITRSQTMPDKKIRCLYYAVSFSKYYIANTPANR